MRAEPLGIDASTSADARQADARRRPDRRARAVPDDRRRDRRLRATLAERAHAAGGYVAAATDLLALTLIEAPGDVGRRRGARLQPALRRADGLRRSARRLLRHDASAFERQLPGRIIGAQPGPPRRTRRCAWRSRRASSTSAARRRPRNICTAQVLLAIMAGFYAVYHGPDGLHGHRRARPRRRPSALAAGARRRGPRGRPRRVLRHAPRDAAGERGAAFVERAAERRRHQPARFDANGDVGVALDETVTDADLADAARVFGGDLADARPVEARLRHGPLRARRDFLTHPRLPPLPLGDRDAALPQAAGEQGPVARARR